MTIFIFSFSKTGEKQFKYSDWKVTLKIPFDFVHAIANTVVVVFRKPCNFQKVILIGIGNFTIGIGIFTYTLRVIYRRSVTQH